MTSVQSAQSLHHFEHATDTSPLWGENIFTVMLGSWQEDCGEQCLKAPSIKESSGRFGLGRRNITTNNGDVSKGVCQIDPAWKSPMSHLGYGSLTIKVKSYSKYYITVIVLSHKWLCLVLMGQIDSFYIQLTAFSIKFCIRIRITSLN